MLLFQDESEALTHPYLAHACLAGYKDVNDAERLAVDPAMRAGAALSDLRRGRNMRHVLTGLLRQSVYRLISSRFAIIITG